MTFGVVLLLLAGICWAGIAAVVGRTADRRGDIDFIQFAAAQVIMAAAVVRAAWRASFPAWSPLWISLVLAGSCNYLMLHWMRRAMESGNKGAVWGIVQSAMICPFAMGMLCFGADASWRRFAGIGAVLAGIAIFGRMTPERGGAVGNRRWIVPTLGAFAASGAAQCLASLPSYSGGAAFPCEWRAFLVQFGTASAFCCCRFPFRRSGESLRRHRGAVLLLAAIQIATLFFLFYRGLDIVAAHGCGSIGYPTAQGTAIVCYVLCRRDRGPEAAAAAASLCTGIFLLAA